MNRSPTHPNLLSTHARAFDAIAVKVVRPFCLSGKPIASGQTVTLARHDVESLAALGKVRLA